MSLPLHAFFHRLESERRRRLCADVTVPALRVYEPARARVESLDDALLDGLVKSSKSSDDLSDDADDSSNSTPNLFSKPPRLLNPSSGCNGHGCTNSLLPPFTDIQDGSRKRGAVAPNSKLGGHCSLESVKARSSMLLKPPSGSIGANCLLGVW